MRYMSFMLTTDQIRNRTKTVTRRLKWNKLQPGDLLHACVKCMGLKPGEKVQKLAVIRVKSVHNEPLHDITLEDVRKEGFPLLDTTGFIDMFCKNMTCESHALVNRIEFEYV